MQVVIRLIVVFLLVGLLGVLGVFAASRLWPLPQGQGFAFVAHPVFALAGCGVAAIAATIATYLYPSPWGWWLMGGVVLTWTISSLIFLSA